MDDLVRAVDREEYARKESRLKVGQAGGDAAARWLQSRKQRWVFPLSSDRLILILGG